MVKTLRMKCWYCGEEFLAQRSSAKYCGANCRKSYSRIIKKLEAQAETAASELWKIDELLERFPVWGWYGIRLFEFVRQEAETLRDGWREKQKEQR